MKFRFLYLLTVLVIVESSFSHFDLKPVFIIAHQKPHKKHKCDREQTTNICNNLIDFSNTSFINFDISIHCKNELSQNFIFYISYTVKCWIIFNSTIYRSIYRLFILYWPYTRICNNLESRE